MERARWESLMYKLKDHEKLGDNIDLLISKLRQKELLRSDVPGNTVSERVEMLVAALNTTLDGRSDSFVDNFLEVLQSIPAFEDLAVQYTSKQPEQESDSGNGKSGSDRHFDNAPILAVVESNQKINPALAEGTHDVYEIRGSSESRPQEEYCKEIESMRLRVSELTEKCDNLEKKRDEEVEYLKHKLTTTEIRAEHTEQAKEEAEQQSAQQRRDFQIERSASQNQIRELQVEIRQLKEQLDEAQCEQVWCSEKLQSAQKKIVLLQFRVYELEQEKEESSSPPTCAIVPLKPFYMDVEQTDKKPLGCGCYGSVVKVRCTETGTIFAAKKFRSDFEEQRGLDKKFHTEFTLLHQLKHDHIVCYVGFAMLPDSKFPALLMQLLDTNLHAHLESQHNIPLPEKAHILLGVGKGLEYLHGKGVLHRDLTAQNVLLKVSDAGSHSIAKIADFGNSRIMTTDPIQLESLSSVPGTIVYLPPEAHTHNYNAKIDIFSFGHIALFVCTQTFPRTLLPEKYLANCADGTKEWLARSEVERRREYFDKVHDRRYPVPLMRKCLDDDADKRPSASEVVPELETICSTLIPMDDVVDSPVEANDSNDRGDPEIDLT